MPNRRLTKERDGKQWVFPLAAGASIVLGTMVAMDASGNAVPASATAGLTVVGIAEGFRGADNELVATRRGCFNFDPAASDAPTLAHVGQPVYAADAVSVATTDTGNKPQAGILLGVDDDGCWVRI